MNVTLASFCRKIEPNKIPSCWISCLLVSLPQQPEILMTALKAWRNAKTRLCDSIIMLPRFYNQFKTLKTPYHSSELVGQTNPVLRRIQLLIRTIQSYQFIPKWYARQIWVLVKTFWKDQYFISQMIGLACTFWLLETTRRYPLL